MNKNIGITLGIIVVIGAIVWAVTAANKAGDNKMMTEQNSNTMMEDKKAETNDAMMKEEEKKKDDSMMEEKSKEEAMMEKSGAYKDYSSEAIASEQSAGNKVVLFFHATWCPYCKAADAAFKTNADEIPAGVTVLKTDYDSQTELKTKYGVTTQHTFVQIDNDGQQVAKWVSGDTAALKANLK